MERALLIAAGGGIGSWLRYVLGGFFQNLLRDATFPVGTLVVNLAGSLFIGIGFQLAESRGAFGDMSRAFFFVGLLGGFTTFSAFSNETFG
jgi:fluoride exporter